MNPHGLPVTDETLKQMSKYRNRTITREDLAREAMSMIHAEDKDMAALAHALDLKNSYGAGVSTLVLVYNATGGELELVDKMDWLGYVYREEPLSRFQNGQWIAFLHAHPTSQSLGCEAARVFRAKKVGLFAAARDFMISWFLPFSDVTQNSAYTEVREQGHFPQHWDLIKGSLLERAGKVTRDQSDHYCASTVSVGGYTSSELIAVLQHKFNPLPDENDSPSSKL